MAKTPYFVSNLRVKRPNSKAKVTKRYLKFLEVNKDPIALKTTLRHAPDSVIKTICDFALNAQQGDVTLSRSQKKLLRKHKSKIEVLVSKVKPLKQKRHLLQTGGFAFLPALIAAVLPTIGSILISRLSRQE